MDGEPIASSLRPSRRRAGGLAWLGRIEEAERWLDRVDRGAGAGGGVRDRACPALRARLRAAWAGSVRGGAGGVPRRGEDAAFAGPASTRSRSRCALGSCRRRRLMGETAAARAALAALDAEERDGAGMRIAAAALALAEGRPQDVVDVVAPMIVDAPDPVVDGPRRCSTCAGRPSTRCCSTPSPEISSAIHAPPRHRSSARSSWPSADGMILQFMLVPVRELLERHPGTAPRTPRCCRRSSTCSRAPRHGSAAIRRRCATS